MLSTLLLRRGGTSSRRVAGGEARRWFSNGGFGESSKFEYFLLFAYLLQYNMLISNILIDFYNSMLTI